MTKLATEEEERLAEARDALADLRSKVEVVNDLHDKAVAAQDRLIAELRSERGGA